MRNFNLIKKAIAIVAPKSTVLPILECVLVMDNTVTITDLNTTIIFKEVGIGIDFVQNAKEFATACGFINNPIFSKNHVEKLTISGNDGEVFTYRYDDIGNFPKTPSADAVYIGKLSVKDCGLIKRALTVVGKDELRPAMCAVALKDGYIMATDAHCAIFERSDFIHSEQILIGRKCARLMDIFPNSEFNLSASENHLKIENEYAVIVQRIDDNKFPNLLAVIPNSLPIEMSVDKKEFINTLKKASTCANTATRAVVLGINSRLTVSSEDIMDERSYKRQLSCMHSGDNIEIGMNVRMLLNIISTIKTPEITFKIQTGDKAFLINDNALQMPVRLSQHA